MSEEILINVTARETRVALLENGVLQELQIERESRRGLVGNIYKGKVSRVLPGIQAAFVDVGLERTAFLHAADALETAYEDHEGAPAAAPEIHELLHAGQELLVQVLKDPLGSKGARLTTHLSIPSRFLVYLPGGTGVGVSNRIEDPAERTRLADLMQIFSADAAGGYIVRTVAEGASPEALRADLLYLHKLWATLAERASAIPAGALLHADLPLPLRMLRDYLGSRVDHIRVDSAAAATSMHEFAATFAPAMLPLIELYDAAPPIFDLYGIEEEIGKALERRVPLKSGGSLVIDQTEAMTTVDVNTGAYVGQHNLEDTVLKTNLEAAQAVARQLRLRNLGGIIVIDFIDMQDATHREQVLEVLQEALAKDRARTEVSPVSALGLVEMTRKRTRESLEHILCMPCPVCQGRGSLRTAQTVCYDVFRELLRVARQFEVRELRVLAAPEVIDLLLEEESTALADLGTEIEKPIRLQAETLYTREQFDVVPL
ncbi:MAG: ribonuclease G [Gammaproteobacteria bacterium]